MAGLFLVTDNWYFEGKLGVPAAAAEGTAWDSVFSAARVKAAPI